MGEKSVVGKMSEMCVVGDEREVLGEKSKKCGGRYKIGARSGVERKRQI